PAGPHRDPEVDLAGPDPLQHRPRGLQPDARGDGLDHRVGGRQPDGKRPADLLLEPDPVATATRGGVAMSIRSIPFTRRETRGFPSTTVVRLPAARDWKRTLWIRIFLLPTVVLYGLYTVYPIIASYWYSFVEWNGFEADQRFVGIQNYRA